MRQSSQFCFALVLAFCSLAPLPLAAQQPKRRSTPNDRLISTEVAADQKVTFRIYAPKATEVSISGDFGNGGKLTKDEQGIWSITLGPLLPDYYTYVFNVDGARVIDPKNPVVKPGLSSLESMFLVPGKDADFEVTRDVPHGQIHIDWYRSNTLDSARTMRVYTPPGYDGDSEKYPALYLLHGGGDEDSAWSTIGRAGFILDNLIAEKKSVPMLVVMPNGSIPRPANLPRFTPGTPLSPEERAAIEAWQDHFTDELLKEVVPHVEKHYRVHSGRDHRAIAGLSMGGGQSLRMATTHPDEFAYVSIWSAGLSRENGAEFEKRHESFFKRADQLNKTLKLFSICVGDRDFAVNGSKSLAEVLEKHGIKHELHISAGGHTWINWRHYLSDLAPKLFR